MGVWPRYQRPVAWIGTRNILFSLVPPRVQSPVCLRYTKKTFSIMRTVTTCSESVQSLSWQIFKTWLDKALSNLVCTHGSLSSEQEAELEPTQGPLLSSPVILSYYPVFWHWDGDIRIYSMGWGRNLLPIEMLVIHLLWITAYAAAIWESF